MSPIHIGSWEVLIIFGMFVIDTNTILGRWVRLALAGNISYPPICKAAAYGARAFKYDVMNYKLINICGTPLHSKG